MVSGGGRSSAPTASVAPVTAHGHRARRPQGGYRDLPLGAVGAAVVAVAERLGADEIATIDRGHFRVVRPRHLTACTLLPKL